MRSRLEEYGKAMPLKAWAALEEEAVSSDSALVGPRDSRVQEVRTTEFPWKTVCYLCRDFGSGQCAGCSGTLVAPTVVLTAAHCLWSLKRRVAPRSIRVCPGRRDRDTLPYGGIESREFWIPEAFRSGKQPGPLDVGVIRLPRPFPGIARFMRARAAGEAELRRLATEGLVFVAGYPSDRPLGTMWRHAERLKRFDAGQLFYSIDTCPGHSGSALWARQGGEPTVIGVHTAGVLDEQGRAFGCDRGTVLAPPGALNRGVRLTPEALAALKRPEAARTGPWRMARLP